MTIAPQYPQLHVLIVMYTARETRAASAVGWSCPRCDGYTGRSSGRPLEGFGEENETIKNTVRARDVFAATVEVKNKQTEK